MYRTHDPAALPPALLERLKADGLTPVGPFEAYRPPVRPGVYLVLTSRLPGQAYVACARHFASSRWRYGATFTESSTVRETVAHAQSVSGIPPHGLRPFVWYGFEKTS